jgi:uncharacterized protein (TIGR02597 family)
MGFFRTNVCSTFFVRSFTPSLVSFLVVALSLQQASAISIVEPFADATASGGTTYPIGASFANTNKSFPALQNATGGPWYGVSNTVPALPAGIPTITNGNLSYPGLPASTGNSVYIPPLTGVTGRMTLPFQETNGQVYYSFLLKVVDVSALSTSSTANFFTGLGDNVGSQSAALARAQSYLVAKKSGSGYLLGIGKNKPSTANIVYDSTVRNVGDTLFVVANFDYATTGHPANMWINPVATAFGSTTAPTATVSVTSGTDLNSPGIQSFMLGCFTNAPPGCIVDEVRVGLSWAMVTGAPDIETATTNVIVEGGTTLALPTFVVGGTPLTYKWLKNGVTLSNGGNVTGATSATLTLSGISTADAGSYSLVASNSYGSTTGLIATVSVNDLTITLQPASQVAALGSNATFHVGATGIAPFSYRWLKNGIDLSNGGNIANADTSALTISAISAADVATYSVRVTNGIGHTALSTNAELFTSDPSITPRRPNIIFILCDDLGYGDVGVLYQNSRAAGLPREFTPNIDSFANEGLTLYQHYCPAPVCAPSRASLLLGVHQGHANVHDQQWDKALADNHTLARVLKKAGYSTAAIGKWGLGGDDQGGTTPADWPAFATKRGFDYYFGYERHADGHEHYPKEAIYSSKSKECYDGTNNVSSSLDKCYTTDLFTARAKTWIQDQRSTNSSQPFFLYLAFDTPHAVYEFPTQAYPSGGGTNGGLQWIGTPGHMINTASGTIDSYVNPDYASATYDDDNNPNTPQVAWPEIFQRFAMGVRRIDDAVGDVKKLLQDLAIDTNTIVVFTSDNGPTTEDYLTLTPSYVANFFDTFGPMDGVKRDSWEGGIRMPTFVRWPGSITAGASSQSPSEFQDWMPTFTELAGFVGPARSDGVSLVPTLLGSGSQRASTIYVEYDDEGSSTPNYSEFEPAHRGRARNEMQVIRLNGFQGVRYNIQSQTNDFEIYDVAHDLKQATNLATQASFATLQQQMKDRVLQLRRPDASAPRPYDSELVPATAASQITSGIQWSAYAEAFPWVPELTTLTANASGTTNHPTVSVRTRDNDIGLLFTGYINVPNDGAYTFYMSADTGAFLRIHDAILIDADYGYVGGTELSSTIPLKAGLHPFRLYYARRSTGVPSLALSWSGPSISKQQIPDAVFFRDQTTVFAKAQLANISANADGTLSMSWSVDSNGSYTFQYKSNLLDSQWIITTNYSAGQSVISISNPATSNVQGFYQMSGGIGSDIAGFVKLPLLGLSDNYISLPFLRPAAAVVTVSSISSNLITVAGSPGWSSNQFVYSAGAQSNTYYARFTSGAAEGRFYPVAANGTNTLTLTLGSDNLNAVGQNDALSVEPFWTFKTVFPNGSGVNISLTSGNRNTEVLIPDFTSAGINLSAAKFYYFSGGLWKLVGQSTDRGDDVLLPNTHFVVRHNVSTNTTLTTFGVVAVSKLALPLITTTSNQQDNFLALTRPVSVSLDNSGLVSSGAFAASPLPGALTDELLTFDNTVAQRNKSSSAIYYFWNGAWRRVGAGTNIVGQSAVFAPGNAVIVRKATNSVSPLWLNSPTY